MGGTISRRDLLAAAAGLAFGAAFAPSFESAALAAGDAALTHRMLDTNGVRLHVAEQGEGPLVILCHGFPECWYSWRHQLPALANAGFHAVAPDLRGYGRSQAPSQTDSYTIVDDIGDIVGLVDALGAKDVVIVGHDIGATIAWQAALLRPDRFRAVIALSPPFRPRGFGGSVPPTTRMPQTKDAMFYQLYLQTPQAQTSFERDLSRTFRAMFSGFSGNGQPAVASAGLGAGMVPRSGPALNDPSSLPTWITDSDIAVYVDEYKRSGFSGPLAWWRNIDRSWELLAPFTGMMVSVPALYMAGKRDFIVKAFGQFIPAQYAMVPKLRPAIMLEGCGHWTQQERPQEINAAMIDFLRSV
jgi:pimeloyl-ACP methyl ester carboxylesterase